MFYLRVDSLSKAYHDKILFQDVAFSLSKGQREALVTPTCTVQTTLTRLLAGQSTADAARIHWARRLRPGLLPPEPRLNPAQPSPEALDHSDHAHTQ